MKKFLTDMHTHSAPASHDGRDSAKEMLERAQELDVAFYGFSEHFDYDYDLEKMKAQGISFRGDIDAEAYFHSTRHLQEDYEGVINVAVGAEFGFSKKPEVQDRYAATYEKYRPDYVINSVHSIDGIDLYWYKFTQPKKETYRKYLGLIRESLDATYHYDIVAHLGYVARYVSFEDRSFDLEEFGEEMDDILKTIIAKDKILEVNSSSKNLPQLCLPDINILQRYYDLGGRKVSFGSDSHNKDRLLDKREEIVLALKKIGFTHITVPFKGEHIKVEI